MTDNFDDGSSVREKITTAFNYTSEPRERASDDWLFAHFNQWDEQLDEYSDNEYRGQFDIITRQLRQVKGEMLANPISVRYRAVGGEEANKKQAELLQGMYRASMRTNMAKEAIDVAVDSQVSVGFGAWRICTEYDDHGENDVTTQRIVRKPIHEANNVVYFDPGSSRKDKSDAKWGGVLSRYTRDSYDEMVEEYGLDKRTGTNASSPSDSGVFAFSGGEHIYVAEHYEIKKKKRKMLIMSNGYDRQVVARNNKEEVSYLSDIGYDVESRKEVEYREVLKSIVDGEGVIDGPTRIAGEHIPIIPVFGEWRFIEGQEYWEGMVRRAKDAQRLHNMGMSFIADQVGRSPRRRPVFTESQVRGKEAYFQAGANYPYAVINDTDAQGNPINPMFGYLEGPQISAAETAFLQLTEKAVQDVTVTPVVGENAMSDGVTEGQLRLANASNQMQTFIYQDNLATAYRRDGEVYQSIAAEIYVEEMEVVTMGDDDSTEAVVINKSGYDEQGMPFVENEIADKAFEVYTDVGPSFTDQKDEAKEKLLSIAQAMGPQDPYGRLAYLQYMTMIEVPGGDGFENYLHKEALKAGIKEPKSEEDKQYMMQLQQQAQQQSDPMQMEGQARIMEGQASLMDKEIDMFNAETKRAEVVIKAEKAGIDAQKVMAETEGQQIKNASEFGNALKGTYQ